LSLGKNAKAAKMLSMVKPSKSRTTYTAKPTSPRETSDFSEASTTSPVPQLNLADHFLIAMPSMLDPIFGGTVVYLCEHNADGAVGVIINKPTDMTMGVLFDRIDLKLEIAPNHVPLDKKPVMFGGPVQVERGFVLHAPHGAYSSMMKVTDEIAMTTSKDVLEAVAVGDGPRRLLVTLGCSGWSAGQLEEEIARNGWLTVRADPAIIFDTPIEERFVAAMKLLGIDPMMLTGDAGHA
jgi:putative transcriptional regulator